MNGFSEFDLIDDLDGFFKENKIDTPTEVQKKTIPIFKNKKNLSVLAQTGTGKTLAYALALFHLIKINDDEVPMESQFASPRAIILSPTRELNQQVFKVLKSVSHHAKLRIRSLVGGDKGKRSKRSSEEAYDILVSSPTALLNALVRKELSLQMLEHLVFDEADQLLDMGFAKEIEKIIKQVSKSAPDCHIALYSATWPAQYQNFVQTTFGERIFHEVTCQGGVQLKRNIETYNISLSQKEKPLMIEGLIKEKTNGAGIVFVNKKDDVLKVATKLKEQFPRRAIHSLHGDMAQGERKDNYKKFSEKGGILVASDIAARGLDIKELSWIVNYDLPFEAVYYIHRCGRCGRNNKQGYVFNFVTPDDQNLIKRINEAIMGQSSLSLKTIGEITSRKAGSKKATKNVTKKVTKKTSHTNTRKKTPRYKKAKGKNR